MHKLSLYITYHHETFLTRRHDTNVIFNHKYIYFFFVFQNRVAQT